MPPFSVEEATQQALIPIGQHNAPAIVVAVLFFGFLLAAVANYIYTRYSFYDVVIFSAALRAVGLSTKAVFLTTGHYRPALEGVFLAFVNAGYGANTAASLFGMGTWLGTVGHRFYPKAEWTAYRYLSWALVACVACFGPILGVIAAGIEFGNYDSPMAEKGERIRACASYGLLSVTFAFLLLCARVMVTVFVTGRQHAQRTPATATEPEQRPGLVALFFVTGCFLAIRGCTGVVAIYPSKVSYWLEDAKYYSLDSFPEFCSLLIQCWPTLFARMAQQWPRATGQQGKQKDADLETGGKQGELVSSSAVQQAEGPSLPKLNSSQQ